jgi:8-oxo-dGTP pyrophosphatase MutT (NUDIX family)
VSFPPDPAAFRDFARTRLDSTPSADAFRLAASDFALSGDMPQDLPPLRAAAVLAAIVARDDGFTVLLTERATGLRAHSGQIAFPGGKIDPGETPLEAALREAEEEIGLDRAFVEPLGWLDVYSTGTGFRIAPLVALVQPGFALTLNAHEVADAFETPLAFLMDEANHQIHERDIGGRLRRFYAMPHNDRFIWGATAGMLRNLWERLA